MGRVEEEVIASEGEQTLTKPKVVSLETLRSQGQAMQRQQVRYYRTDQECHPLCSSALVVDWRRLWALKKLGRNFRRSRPEDPGYFAARRQRQQHRSLLEM